MVHNVELAGLRCAWLAGDAAADIVRADRITREAGLGAATRDEEEPVLERFLGASAAQFGRMGVEVKLSP